MSELKLSADTGGGTVSLKGPSATTSNADVAFVLPVADGSANQVLKTDGSKNLGWVTSTDTDTDSLSFRNLLINGSCQVAQRATSSSSHGYSTVDRVKPYATSHATSVTYSQSDVASGNDCYNAGFRKAFKVAISGAGNTSNSAAYIGHYKQRIEGQYIAQSGWKYWDSDSKITLSFWIKSTTADTFQLQFYVDDNTKKKYNTPVTATTSWTKITKTVPGHSDINIDNDNNEGFAVQLVVASGADLAGTVTQNTWVANTTAAIAANNISTWLSAGAGNVETTGWQLEVGDTATDFEHRSFGDELFACQRYYESVYLSSYSVCGQAYATNHAIAPQWLRQEKRANPSITLPGVGSGTGEIAFMSSSAGWPSNHGSIGINDVTVQKFHYSGSGYTSSFTTGHACLLHCNGTAVVKVDAEI